MIDKSLIVLNNIEPVYQYKDFVGEEATFKQIGIKVDFTYKKMKAEIELNAPNIYGEEIKDLIIEQLQ